MRELNYNFVDVLISNSKDAIVRGYWHAAAMIWNRAQKSSPKRKLFQFKREREYCVNLRRGGRESALLLMYKGSNKQLSYAEIEEITGFDVTKAPFTKVIRAKGRNEIEHLLSYTFQHEMKLENWLYFGTGDEVPKDFCGFTPPDELHPSKWEKLAGKLNKPETHEFEVEKVPEKNPTVAFSRFANDLKCAYCGKQNVAPSWPRNGDNVAFYYQTEERTKEKSGIHRVKVHCQFCTKDWYVVWDQDPS
jgi:hypothetical protein